MNIIIKIKKFIIKQIVDVKTYGLNELFRKLYLLIKIFIRVPIDIVAIMSCLIIRLISPWLIVRIQRLPAENFGEFVWRTSIYSCKKKYKIDSPAKKYVDLLYIHHNTKVYNKQIAKMWKRKFNFFSSYLLDPINRVNKLIPGWRKYAIDALSIRENDINNLFEKCQPLDFTSEEEIYGKKILSKFGLKDTDKFVCLAVRDGEYQLKKISARYRD